VNQAEVAFLDQIGKRQAAVQVMLGDADHEPQVVLDHLLPRFEVAVPVRARVLELLGRRQQRALADLVQVDLGDVVEEVGSDADDRHVQRQIARLGIGLRCRGRLVVVCRRMCSHA